MYLEILSKQQQELLNFISVFRRNYYLVGGTAIALYIGHRQSIDFDLFTSNKINKSLINKIVLKQKYKKQLIFSDDEQIHFLLNDIKVTFFYYPYTVMHNEMLKNVISLPSLLTLSAMKAFALGRRAKWKDYVELYYIIKNHYSINNISVEAKKIFGDLYSEKLFRGQLAFHDDIDYTEPVEYINSFYAEEQDIKHFLIEKALDNN